MKKNCNNCRHLEFVTSDHADEWGWDCHKRNNGCLETKDEIALHNNLDREEYRGQAKVCCELKAS